MPPPNTGSCGATLYVTTHIEPSAGSTVAVGDQMEVNGSIGAYNKGLQVNGSSATATVLGKQDVTYPAAKDWSPTATVVVSNLLPIYTKIAPVLSASI